MRSQSISMRALGAALAMYGVSSLTSAQVVIAAGDDTWMTPPPIAHGLSTFIDFSGSPLPGGFFGPGSDPFSGVVDLRGLPLDPPNLGSTDTIVNRLTDTLPLGVPGLDAVQIEIQALSLVSLDPIIVTFGGGGSPTPWDLKVSLSAVQPQGLGAITILRLSNDGGTFDAFLPVIPRLIFQEQGGPGNQSQDPGPAINLNTSGAPWALIGGSGGFDPFTRGIDVIGPGINVDGNCDGAFDYVTVGNSNFQPGYNDLLECSFNQEAAMLGAHGVATPGDSDMDGWPDECDNCPADPNEDQTDLNGNDVGDICELAVVPTMPTWGFALLIGLFLAIGAFFVVRTRARATA